MALELKSILPSIFKLQEQNELAILLEPLAHAKSVQTPVDATDRRDCGFLATQEGPLAVVLFFLEVLYLFQPPNLS